MDSGANKFTNLNNTPDSTKDFEINDISQNKAMAILAYIGILVLIPIFAAKNSKFARFHASQGLNLFILEIACSILSFIFSFITVTRVRYAWGIPYETQSTPWFLNLIIWIISIILLILSIIGIINAAKGKAKEIPIIGKLKILKINN